MAVWMKYDNSELDTKLCLIRRFLMDTIYNSRRLPAVKMWLENIMS